MRKTLLSIAIFLFSLTSVMGQLIPITLPADGNWPTIVGDSIMIIGPRQNELTEEQRYFNPIYLMVYPGKEHLKAQMIRAGACDCDLTKPNRRIGVFSVAPDKKVSFSQGNLQYLPAINLWKFADTQYEYLGNANKYLKPTFRNWVDLFGWSASNTTAPFGVSTSTNAADYAGDFVDWGTNTICGDAPGTWRTLSVDEWGYLFQGRKNATQLYSKGNIDGLRGMIILPDNWVMPEGLHFTAQPTNLTMELDINTYTQAEWQRMEEAGAVFLCPTGRRDGTKIDYLEYYGGYWSSSKISNSNHVCHMYYNYKSKIFMTDYKEGDYSYGTNGRAVRLVHDTIVPQTIPDPCLVVKVNDTLSINMMCVEGGTFMMGAMESDKQAHANEKPAHQVTLTYDYYIGQTEVTQALWQAVMGNNPSTMIGDDLPVNNVLWEEADAFVKRLSQMTGYTFHLPTEAEWEFAARGGKKSKGYLYAGSDDVDEVAWYANNSGGTTHAVGTKKPNELGIYDMSGNAWEWCSDWLAPYSAEAQVNPIGPATGEYHVYHGGGWNHGQRYARSSHRRTTTQGYIKTALGLRVAIREKIEPEAVDLGLSVKWANFNIGAFDPTHYGDYFAWGETEPKETYSWATYKWCDGTDANITKYNTADGKTILEPEDDAAQVHWGGKWRMPTEEEQQELIDRCSWERTNLNGVIGYKVTGPNGNSIFIPIAGAYNSFDDQLNSVGSIGWIYSSTIATEIRAYEIHIEEGIILQKDCSRCVGLTIRPVYDDRPPKRIGVFSVAADKQVSFSQGNVQYTQSTDEWRFAREQYEYIGAANIKDGALADRIDMFGWSADNTTAPFGVSTSTNDADYTGEFVDWGVNTICGEAPGTWRTLSADEWEYLLKKRKNASDLYGVAQVAGVNGMIILPDDWEEANGIVFKSGLHSSQVNDYSVYQSFTDAQWLAMENAGAVFLPALGYRDGTNVEKCNTSGYYWSNTTSDEESAYRLYFYSYFLAPNDVHSKYRGRSVRLVHDTIVPKPEPEYVDLGLSVKWATFNVGATSPNEIGNFYAWGEIEPKDTYTVNNYKWWNKTSKEITKYCTIDSLAYGGVADGLTELQPQDDIAHTLKGEHWRMPNLEECKELGNGCTWTVSTRQGQIGFEGTSKINGNTIFLPVVGFRAGVNLVHETLGGYWSSTLNIEKQSCAMGLYLNRETPSVGIYYNSSRQNGFLIRPVYDEVPDPCLVVKVNDTLSINLMCVEGGTFMMGSDAPDAQADEQPVHEVTLSDYYIGQTEVTQHLWKAVMGSGNNPSATKGNNLPVTNITWNEAQQFVERLSELTGMRFRLPTEAEWEYAARGGQKSKGYTYAGSNDIDQVGWYNGNSSNKTHAVGQKQSNELGIYDMTGNVWEYCYDWHTPYAAQAQTNPTGAATGDKHVLRGGCYHYDPKNCTNTNRHSYYTPDKGGASTGLRIVLEP